MLRLRAAALLLLSPGVGGAAVRAAHACPAPASATADMPAMEHHEHSAPTTPPGEHGTDCQCIGACDAFHAIALPTPTIRLAEAMAIVVVPAFVATESRPPAEHPRDRHPPSTAPPLA